MRLMFPIGAGRTRPCHRRISAPLLFAGEQGTVYRSQIAQTALAVNLTQPSPLICLTVQGPEEQAR
jgi:hypothetical protein